jgi:hypothetical protein
MEERAITQYKAATDLTPGQQMDTMTLAQMFVKSGWFAELRDVAQAVVKMQCGAEAGFGPMASIMGIHVVQGKPVWGSNLMAAAIKRSGRYNYRVQVASDDECVIEFFEGGQSVGTARFSIKEAEHAGLASKDNWRKYASDMLFARALSRGCRRYCPDVFGGITAYVPEDLQTTPEPPVVVSIEKPEPPQASVVEPETDGFPDEIFQRWMRRIDASPDAASRAELKRDFAKFQGNFSAEQAAEFKRAFNLALASEKA